MRGEHFWAWVGRGVGASSGVYVPFNALFTSFFFIHVSKDNIVNKYRRILALSLKRLIIKVNDKSMFSSPFVSAERLTFAANA